MNEEYLWNKTGSDAEIEGFENGLRAFSYKQTAPPELPAKTFVLVEEPRRSFFRLGFALTFAAAFLVLVSIAWFMIPKGNAVIPTDSAKAIAPQPEILQPAAMQPAPNIEIPDNLLAFVKTRHTVRPSAKTVVTRAIHKKHIEPAINLTAEEKYAYRQLMLALSITESKLRIVKDAVAGNEELKTNVDKGKDLYQK